MSDYRLEVKIKNNRVWQAIMATVPNFVSLRQAADHLGVRINTLCDAVNMKLNLHSRARRFQKLPLHERPFSESAQIIATALRSTPEYLFNEDLYCSEFQTKQIIEYDPPVVPNQIEYTNRQEFVEQVRQSVASLWPQQAEVLVKRFGLNGEDEMTLKEVAKSMSLTPERIRQIEAKALRMLRNPKRSKFLRPFLEK